MGEIRLLPISIQLKSKVYQEMELQRLKERRTFKTPCEIQNVHWVGAHKSINVTTRGKKKLRFTEPGMVTNRNSRAHTETEAPSRTKCNIIPFRDFF